MFVVNVPVVAVGIIAALVVVPESRAPVRVDLDPIGALLSVAAVVALTYAFIEAPGQGWSDPRVDASLAIAVLGAAGFVAWERRAAHRVCGRRRGRGRSVPAGAGTSGARRRRRA